MNSRITADLSLVARALRSGSCVAIPTDTVYGLAALLSQPEAPGRLRSLKQRSTRKPMAVLVDSVAMAEQLGRLSAPASRVATKFWPGALTIVVTAAIAHDLGGDPTTIGLRQPADRNLAALIGEVGPLIATSANEPGELPLRSAEAIAECFPDSLPVVLDGEILSAEASTVVDLRGETPLLLRAGPVTLDAIMRSWRGDERPGSNSST
jgi:L-threonylcarbamoyladenylate synthase